MDQQQARAYFGLAWVLNPIRVSYTMLDVRDQRPAAAAPQVCEPGGGGWSTCRGVGMRSVSRLSCGLTGFNTVGMQDGKRTWSAVAYMTVGRHLIAGERASSWLARAVVGTVLTLCIATRRNEAWLGGGR